MELDERTADLDARSTGCTARREREAERRVLAGGLLGSAREERDVVEVVVDVGLRLDEAETHAFCADVEVRRARQRTLEVEPVGQRGECGVEIGDAEGDVLECAEVSGPVGGEERELSPPCIGAQQREPFGSIDHVHPQMRREKVCDRIALGDPVGDVVELRRVHGPDGTRRVTGYAESSGGFWTLNSVAYASVRSRPRPCHCTL